MQEPARPSYLTSSGVGSTHSHRAMRKCSRRRRSDLLVVHCARVDDRERDASSRRQQAPRAPQSRLSGWATSERMLTETIASGRGSRPNSDVQNVTGVPPISFADFARRTAQAWA
jgi:hypothetical protein